MSQEIAIARLPDSLAAVEVIYEDYWELEFEKAIPLESSEKEPQVKEKVQDIIMAQRSISHTIMVNVIILVSSIGGLLLLIIISPLLTPVSIIIFMICALVQAFTVIKSETECIMKKINKRLKRKNE